MLLFVLLIYLDTMRWRGLTLFILRGQHLRPPFRIDYCAFPAVGAHEGDVSNFHTHIRTLDTGQVVLARRLTDQHDVRRELLSVKRDTPLRQRMMEVLNVYGLCI